LKQIINKIAGFISGSEESVFVIRNSVQLTIFHGISVAIVFLSNYILIKVAGVADYGAYVYIFNLISLLAGFCLLGVDTLVVKNVSIYSATGQYGKLKGALFFSVTIVFASSVMVAFVTSRVGFFLDSVKDVRINWFVLMFSSLIILSLVAVSQACLQALKKISLSQVTEKIIKPALLLLIILILFYSEKITSANLVWGNILAMSLACVISFTLLFKQIGFKLAKVKPEYDTRRWSKSAVAFFTIGLLYTLNSKVDIFLLGLLKGNREVGVYNILMRVSEIIGFTLVIINFVMAPLIARLFEEGSLALLQKMIIRSAQVTMLIGLPVTILIMVFRSYILHFFGVNFMNASDALLILCVGQFVNIATGSVGTLLMMSGYEKFSILSSAVSIIFNIVLNVTLIPIYGVIGAAIAASVSLAIWNSFAYFFVRTKLNIRTTSIGIM
jgi:O-antigen/teichoic acid export membrane protein